MSWKNIPNYLGKRTDFIEGKMSSRCVHIRLTKEQAEDADIGELAKQWQEIYTLLDTYMQKGLVVGYKSYEDFYTANYVIEVYITEETDVGLLRGLPFQRDPSRSLGTSS